jgi:hypothetical protein
MKQISVLFLIVFVAGLSCTERIDIETSQEYTRLIVDGSITTDKIAHSVVLSTTSDYFSNREANLVSDAIVTISDGSVIIPLREMSSGVYITNQVVSGITGQSYTLNVKLSDPVGGHTEYSATSKINSIVRIDSLKLVFHPGYSLKGMYEVRGFFQDPPEPNYYRFMVWRNTGLITDTLSEWYVTDDMFFNGRYLNGWTMAYLHQHLQSETLVTGDILTIEMDAISREYASFIQGAQSEMMGSYPLFTGPPANVKGNINHGAIGFFAAYSVSRAVIVVP